MLNMAMKMNNLNLDELRKLKDILEECKKSVNYIELLEPGRCTKMTIQICNEVDSFLLKINKELKLMENEQEKNGNKQ